jgi:hypothetical protein
MRFLLVFLVVASIAKASVDPRSVAEGALDALNSGDAKKLGAFAHPDLIAHLRRASIYRFWKGDNEARDKTLATGSDVQVIELYFEAVEAVLPNRFHHTDKFIETKLKGDLADVVFQSRFLSPKDGAVHDTRTSDIVLKKVGDDWRFLWSVEIGIHTDVNWTPLE